MFSGFVSLCLNCDSLLSAEVVRRFLPALPVCQSLCQVKLPERFSPLLTTAKEAYLGNLSDEWETVEKEAMALVEYMKKQIEELLRTE